MGNVTLCEAPGNLATTQDRGCIAFSSTNPTMSLAVSVPACAAENRTQDKAELYAFMMARCIFATQRVTDRSAHQGITGLRMQVGAALSRSQQKDLQRKLSGIFTMDSAARLVEFCTRAAASAVPEHDPGYMIAHGMGAFVEMDATPLVAGFEAKATWDDVMKTLLKCSG